MKCAHCGCEFEAVRPRVYCSGQCREQAKYQRGKASGLERRKRDLRNARYVPHPRALVDRSCDEIGCNRKHWALGLCRPHYYQSKHYDRREHHRLVIGALVKGQGRHAVCELVGNGGLWVWCPECRHMAGINDASRLDIRTCSMCDLTFLINAEEMDVLCAAA